MIDAEEEFVCKNRRVQVAPVLRLRTPWFFRPDVTRDPEVFQCERDDCKQFYHQVRREAALRFGFDCPMHEHIVCRKGENKDMHFAVCRSREGRRFDVIPVLGGAELAEVRVSRSPLPSRANEVPQRIAT